MNNLHRELAPISKAAWEQIEEEARRTLKRYLAARRVVDVPEPGGPTLASIDTGHVEKIDSPGDGLQAIRRLVKPLVELRIPFKLTRQAIDDVERGSADSDWAPLKEAARKIAYAEDRAIFDGYKAAGIGGIRPGASNPALTLPAAAMDYPGVIATALDELRLAGVEGPYRLVLGADVYTALSGGSEDGYPLLQHIRRLVDEEIIWAPAIAGGLVLTVRGGDFELSLGQDIAIGYLGHSATDVELYLQESFTFRLLTTEAAVALNAPQASP
ncbi:MULTISPECIES: family 1 encapsulin nanocompartment shell protein [unclassified Pseudomonas]|uniref:family 1 encapsulin nanocompartment shell protein n=1 Tax=unclassified Pseudomonas TaxID=196821 RepID=UPI002447384A|nr:MULTISPECIES: family 1 encapsulin nanocompartment shell protein [unclassified Pseudomonas]MDH0303298.1 family 1 encapsulin nanocompartment shell protein [Pseudomonas sp. GD04091]MDH1985322.1 bacteriocin family protein [Pseudomonas sp. GD03689]